MKKLKNAWAQIVCLVVIIGSAAWAGMAVFQSGVDDTEQQVKYRQNLSEVQAYENGNDSRVAPAMAVQGPMLPAIPMPAPMTPITTIPRSFFPSGTPNGWTKVLTPPPEDPTLLNNNTNVLPATDEKLAAYVKPGILEVYQLNTGNYLVVVLPWERSMMAVTGFALQRMEMTRTVDGIWKAKTGQWVNLPKYMVQDEARNFTAVAAPEAAPTPAGTPATTPAPAAPRGGLLGPGPTPKVGGGGGGLLGPGPTTSGSSFDLKKYQGIYVLFDRLEQKDDVRFDYRLVIIAKPFADTVDRTLAADGRQVNIKVYQPEGLTAAYGNLRVCAPGPVVQPTTTGKVQVKFVSAKDDKSEASFIVLRGQATSKIVEVPAGQEIVAELPVLDEKGRPIVGEGGNKKDDVHTGLVFSTVDVEAETKKITAVLIGADKKEILVDQGKTNGDPAAPEIDVALLYKLQMEREKEYKEKFKGATPDKGDTTYPVPEKDFETLAAGILESLKPNDFYPTVDDETTPPSPLPQLTMTPKPKEIVRRIPVVNPVAPRPTTPTAPIRPPVAPGTPTMPPPMPPGGFGPDRERPTMPDHEDRTAPPPPADAVLSH